MRSNKILIICLAGVLIIAAAVFALLSFLHRSPDSLSATAATPGKNVTETAADLSSAELAEAQASELESVLQQSFQSNRFTFATFAKADDTAGAQMIKDVKGIVDGSLASRAVFVNVDAGNPANRAVMTKFNVSSTVLPITLVIAANGAVTGGYPTEISEPVKTSQFADALVAPGMAAVLKTLQSGKLAAVCFQNSKTKFNKESSAAAEGLRSAAQFKDQVEIALVDPANPDEATLINTCSADAALGQAQLVVIAPPGSIVGKFDGAVTVEAVVSSLLSSLASGCGGGACGPSGCS